MDMKRILQAFDSASTKPVEGASDMAKFLRVVSEAEINQPAEPAGPEYQRYADLMAKYDLLAKELLPDNSGIEKGASPDAIASINNIKAMAAQVAGPNLQAWEQARTASNSASMAQAQASQPAMAAQLEEGANPHKVALPVQMAMQHYQQPKTVAPKKASLLKQYFAEAEQAVQEEEQERKALIKQYASVIAERVLVKESTETNLEETPIDMTGDPNDPVIYGHEKANPMSLKGRIQQTRAQLRELAQAAESNDLAVWQDICAKAKGGLFMGLEQNLEQVRHGIAELAAKRKKGGIASRGIDKNISERSVSQAQAHLMAAAAHNPEFAKKVKMKQSVAKEFNKADKGKNIKSLPVRVPKKK